ncbi:MAG: ABC transporter permease [Lentisphaeria bacterium]|nr:ABC transporter permease [Lentisphaeria bacterium]MBR7127496.1 ABC transporter permease [Lentisphaeria bacterium]
MKKILSVIKKDKLSFAAFIIVLIYVITAIFIDVYSIACEKHNVTPFYNVENQDLAYSPPTLSHWLGTDYLGRDVLSRAIAGSSTAVKIGFIASLISSFIGVMLGSLGGYFGGKTDKIVVWIYSTFASMPTLLFILAFTLLLSKGFLSPVIMDNLKVFADKCHIKLDLFAIYLAIGLTGWVTIAKVVRAEAMKLRNMPYIENARIAGKSEFKILFKDIIPNLFHIVIIYFSMRFVFAIMTEVVVSYLGFGVTSMPSWGVMISVGQERLWRGFWWEVAAASTFLFMLVLSLNILGDSLRDKLDPRD